jgi:hypothetical protein
MDPSTKTEETMAMITTAILPSQEKLVVTEPSNGEVKPIVVVGHSHTDLASQEENSTVPSEN